MLLRPRICCLPLQNASIYYRPASISLISSIDFPIRIYTNPRPYNSKPQVPHHRPLLESVALNPPVTTRPPLLDLPEKLPHLPRYKYYFRVGKAYAVFYKTGLKAIWTNYKLARALPDEIFFSGQAKLHQAVFDGLPRADFQLIRRTRRDIKKVPLFALIWLIFGEFTPLVIIFFTRAVPPTIWFPKQVQKAREEAEERRARIEDPRAPFATPSWESDIGSMSAEPQRKVLKSCAQSLGLYPAWWDRWIPIIIPTSLVRKRVYRRLRELEVDDFAIERDGSVKMLEEEEVRIACEERGIDVLGKKEGDLRADLRRWLEQRKKR